MHESPHEDQAPRDYSPQTILSRVRPGMEVVDRNQSTLGTVLKVYRPVGVDEMGSMIHEIRIRVGDRGLLGLGHDLYVPASVITHLNHDQIVLSIDKAEIGDLVWDRPEWVPPDLDE